ncbi:MAG: MBL fold metallo-hydrolase, partial [Rhodobacteraceae bacterium]|nr:MBL fold metallo-hydrolase [Paracoccaceae bacterium]
ALVPGDVVHVGAAAGRVLDVPGHTVGHVAFVFDGEKLAFTADSLMSGGCGRLFEGSPDQMWASLQSLAALPDDTLICSGHEYTASNLRFAASVDPDNPALQDRIAQVTRDRASGLPTVPVPLAVERATNPFLRAALLKSAVGLPPDAPDAQAFALLRVAKDRF